MKQRRAKSSAAGGEDIGADEPSTSYRPMGAALTLEEVRHGCLRRVLEPSAAADD